MNPFAALESDDEDESFTKVQSHKKTGTFLFVLYCYISHHIFPSTSSNCVVCLSKDSKKPTQAKPTTGAPAPAVTVNNSDKKTSSRGGGGRGDNRNKGRGAGRGGKETGERKNGKREYDRRSGTGR
jgi:hypothetical protein